MTNTLAYYTVGLIEQRVFMIRKIHVKDKLIEGSYEKVNKKNLGTKVF